MINLSKTTWLTIPPIILFLIAGIFAYQWWRVKGEWGKRIETTEGVTIATDKTEYGQGEVVEIIVRNGLDKPIWYIKEVCLPSCCNLYKWEDSEWKSLGNPMPCTQLTAPLRCIQSPEEPCIIEVTPNELKPGESTRKQWGMMIWGELAESGKYQLSFYYGLSKKNYTEKTVYSNEFIIK